MSDRQPEARESAAPRPYVTMRDQFGIVTIEALGPERHRVRAAGALDEDRIVTSHDAAHDLAHELAVRLGAPACTR